MKNIYIFLTLLILQLSNFSYAQKESSFNIFAGPDYNHLMKKYLNSKANINFFGGVSLLSHFKEQQALEGTVGYSIKGMKDNMGKYSAQYITLGANYHYNLSKSLFVFTGVQYSIFLNSSCTNKDGIKTLLAVPDTILAPSPYQDRWNEFNRLGKNFLSWNFSVGISIQKNIKLSFIYEHPFTSEVISTPSFKVKLGISVIKRKSFKELFSNPFLSSQNNTNKQKVVKVHKKPKALVVVLNSYNKKIQVLKENHLKEQKQAIINRRNEENEELIQAFKKEFNVMPIYFIYNDDLPQLLSKNYKGIFVNEQLKKSENIHFNYEEFLIGRLGYNIKETSKDRTTQDTDFLNYGFLIKDKNNQYLPPSFPAYTSGYLLIIKNTPARTIRKVNKSLSKYLLQD